MLLEIHTDLENDKLNAFIESMTEIWEVIPGIPYAEYRVESFNELCDFIRACEEVAGLPLGFDMQLAPKNSDDDEEMFEVRIYNARKPVNL